MDNGLKEEQEAYRRERDELNRKGGIKPKTEPKPAVVRPYAPENIHLSKEEFVAKRRKIDEKAAKLAAFAKELDEKERELDSLEESPKQAPQVKEDPELPVEHTLKAPKVLKAHKTHKVK